MDPCPFCTIINAFPPVDPLHSSYSRDNPVWNSEKLSPAAYVLLATKHVVAFMDIAPLTRGHVLVSPRKHRVKMGDLSPQEMSEIGRVLPIIARSVIRAVLPDIPHLEADYNVVQNNGPGAAQVVPHVHFHIIPRPPLDYRPPVAHVSKEQPPMAVKENTNVSNAAQRSKSAMKPSMESTAQALSTNKYPPAKVPTGMQRSYIQFGRGMRHELDDDDASILVEEMRRCVQLEWRASYAESYGSNSDGSPPRSGPRDCSVHTVREKL